MMGPGFGAEFGRGLRRIGVALLLLGAALGIGCAAGWSYLRGHIDVGWRP